MKRAGWLNAALAAAVAALAAWVYLKPPREAAAEFALSTLKAAEARSIRIERPGEPPVVLEKHEGNWRLTAPFAARADDLRVERMLEIVEARAAHRLPATDLGRFELDRPQVRLIVNDQAFAFGMVAAVAREQYVLTEGAVYTVNPRYGTALPGAAADLASRQVLAAGDVPVRIERGAFTVEQRDGRWTLTPAGPDLSQDDLIRWVEDWRLSSASRVEPYTPGKAPEEIRITLKDGRVLTLGVLSREPELVLARRDEKLRYSFRAELAKRLLSSPGAGGVRNSPSTGR